MDAPLFSIILGAAVAGFVQGLVGFAFALVAMTIWAWSLDPTLAGPLAVFGSIVGLALSFHVIRESFNLRLVLPLVVGGLLGIPIGSSLLKHVDPILFKVGVGFLLILWCTAMLFARNIPRVVGGGWFADAGVGLLGGVMGGLGGLVGPAPTIWSIARGWNKDIQRGVLQSFFLAMQVSTLISYAVSGLVTAKTVQLFAVVAPSVLIPSLLGTRLYARFSDDAYRRLILVVLMLSGVALLAYALPQVFARLRGADIPYLF